MDKQTLINHLNANLAGEFGAIIQYLTYARVICSSPSGQILSRGVNCRCP
jgi:bacterioferritin (cytochrome b1)